MTANSKILLALSVFSALLYLADPWGGQDLIRILTKASVCLFLILMVFTASGATDRIRILLMIALLFSMGGDIFLAVDREQFFVFGLASFLLAHLAYSALFIMRPADHPQAAGRLAIQGLLLILTATMAILLRPVLGGLKIPVFFYIAAITVMGLAACRSRFHPWLVIPGALSFILSDSIIAIDKFLMPIDGSGPLIWITYVLAQYFLCFGILGIRMPDDARHPTD